MQETRNRGSQGNIRKCPRALRRRRQHTPLTIRVPILVTKPLTLSDRNDDRARVEPGSVGASKATHSCKPLFRDARDSCSKPRSHSSSHAYSPSMFDMFKDILLVRRYQGVLFFNEQLFWGNGWPDGSRHGWKLFLLLHHYITVDAR